MKFLYSIILLICPLILSAQLKEIAFSELTAGSGMFFGAQKTTTTITVTVQGPSDRFIAFGFGTGMATGNDAIIWSTLGTGAAPLQLRDHRMIGQGNEPSVDAQQDWTVISNNVSGGNRTIVASRALSTGDANDVTFTFASTTQNLFWAKSASASNQIANHGGNRASGIVRNWVLVDQTAPTLTSTTPADNASGVGLTANLVMNFNEAIALGAGSMTLYDENDVAIQTVSSGSPSLTLSGSTLVFNPTANLIVNTDYYLQMGPNMVTDIAGNAYAGFADNTTWNFNTNDITAPALAAGAFSPADNANGLTNLIASLVVTFNENVQAGTGTIELFSGAGTSVESFTLPGSSQITISGTTVTIDPTADLLPNTSYYVNIQPGAIEDLSGNDYAGFANNTTWNFNTNDIIAPILTTNLTPANGGTDISPSTNIEAQFSEDVQLTGNGTLKVFRSNGTTFATYTSASPQLSISGNQLTITPTGILESSTLYYIEISADFIEDLAGNPYAGITGNSNWSFTTEDFESPQILSLSPVDNTLNVPVTSTLTITFNEAVSLGTTGEIRLIDGVFGAGNQTFDVAAGTGISVSANTITITPSTMMANRPFHVEIDGTAVTDLSGNAFAGISDPEQWNFDTEILFGLTELANSGISWNGTVLKMNDGMSAAIYDAAGKLVKSDLTGETDCSDLISGVYFVHVVSDSGTQFFRIHAN